ncbi:MAG TPA: hypothetical protein VGD37_38670 [Kofleriaceae bacterium]|jgi:hypothetical protein
MRRSDDRTALTDHVARFQDDIRQMALAAAREIVRQELERRLARLQRGAGRVAPVMTRTRTRKQPPAVTAPEQPASTAPAAGTAAGAGAGTGAAPDQPAAGASADGKKRAAWTRDSIVNELASWMASGTAIDAAFVTRHGPPGLVAAARRIFGRFDAALNVAGLQVEKLYPDGPPKR